MNRKNQKGFAVFEVLFFLLAAAVLIGAAYYVGTRHNDNKKASNTSQTSQTSKSSTQNNQTTSSNNIFKFTNLGVQFTLPSSLNDLKSTPATFSDGSFVDYITTNSIENMINQCTSGQTNDAESLSFAGLSKMDGTYDPSQIYGEIQFLKQFSTFFVAISYPNGSNPCGASQSDASTLSSQEHSASAAFIKAFQSSATEIK